MGMPYKIGVWLAALAITANALWPLIATGQPEPLPTEICSAAKTTALTRVAGAQPLPAPPARQETQ